MRRDIVIEIIGMIVLVLTLITCTAIQSHQQEQRALAQRQILINTYNLLNQDMKDRVARRTTIDDRLSTLDTELQTHMLLMHEQQVLLSEVGNKLQAETKERKSEKEQRR